MAEHRASSRASEVPCVPLGDFNLCEGTGGAPGGECVRELEGSCRSCILPCIVERI